MARRTSALARASPSSACSVLMRGTRIWAWIFACSMTGMAMFHLGGSGPGAYRSWKGLSLLIQAATRTGGDGAHYPDNGLAAAGGERVHLRPDQPQHGY